jgi:hypothetical protein
MKTWTCNLDIPIGDVTTADTGVQSVNADHGSDDEDGGSTDDEDETHPVDDKDVVSHVFLPKSRRMCFYLLFSTSFNSPCSTERGYPPTAVKLAAVFHQPDFQCLVRRFLFDQIHLHDPGAPLASDVPLAQCPPFDCSISVYHTLTAVFYSPSDPSGIRGMRQEYIRSNPRWRKRLPRYDTVFVERDPTLAGIRGFDVVRLLALFSFVWRFNYYPCALVRWFKHAADEPDDVMGMWVVQPDFNADGSPAIGVIHLDSVLRAAHLVPVFGDDPMPIELSAEQSLDKFRAFYVNKYIDYHAFEITS